MHYFLICITCAILLPWFMAPGAGPIENIPVTANTARAEVPTVLIREDTCGTLLKNFCENHGNVKYDARSSGGRYEIDIYDFGANKEFFINNNKALLSANDSRFKIAMQAKTLKATFTIKNIKGCACVELPSDVLYALMMQHPLIK